MISKLGSPHTIISRTAFNCIALTAKALPVDVVEALRLGLSSKNTRVVVQCLKGLGLVGEHLDEALVMRVIELMQDPVVGTAAEATAKRLVANSEGLRRSLGKEAVDAIENRVLKETILVSSRKSEVPRILDSEIAAKIAESASWKDKLLAMEELKEKIGVLSSEVIKGLPSLLDFLVKMLCESNVRLTLTALTLTQDLLSIKGLSNKGDLAPLIQVTLNKLGDEKICHRQNAFKVVRTLLKQLPPGRILPEVLKGLNSDNWHQREGCLLVLIASLLEHTQCDFSSYSEYILPLLHDSKAKIRFVAMETLAVLASVVSPNTVISNCVADEVLLERLRARFNKKKIACLKDNWVELPKLTPGSAPLMNSSPQGLNDTATRFTAELTVKLAGIARPQGRARATGIQKLPTLTLHPPDKLPAENSYGPVRPRYSENTGPAQETGPEAELQYLLHARPQQWAEQFEMMKTLRKLLTSHREVLNQVPLRGVIFQLLKWADSLRSSLSKNALIVLGELSSQSSHVVEPELEHILSTVLRRSADTNAFISEEAEKALILACTHCSENKVIPFLIQQASSIRSAVGKSKIAVAFCRIFEKKQAEARKLRDFDKILQTLAAFTKEASSEVRRTGKSALNYLASIL